MNSLYEKTCPQCSASHPTAASACHCGYRFDHADAADAEREERLYAEYLAARAKQSTEAAIAAETRRKASPEDARAIADARMAFSAAEEARKALAIQLERLEGMSRPSPAAADAGLAATPVTTNLPAKPPRRPPATTLAAPIAHPKTDLPPRIVAKPATIQPLAVGPASGTPRLLRSAPTPVVEQDCPVCGAKLATGHTVCACGYSVAPPDLPGLNDPAPVPAIPRAAPQAAEVAGKARLAREAERVAQRLAQKSKICPHCTAEVSSEARECRCGFLFVMDAAPTMPSLSFEGPEQANTDIPLKPK